MLPFLLISISIYTFYVTYDARFEDYDVCIIPTLDFFVCDCIKINRPTCYLKV